MTAPAGRQRSKRTQGGLLIPDEPVFLPLIPCVVPVPPSWNQRHRRGRGGGVYVDPAVTAWDTAATLAMRRQEWRPPAISGHWWLLVRVWDHTDLADLDKRLPTLIDWLKRPDIVGVDDRYLRHIRADKRVDVSDPRCEFLVMAEPFDEGAA